MLQHALAAPYSCILLVLAKYQTKIVPMMSHFLPQFLASRYDVKQCHWALCLFFNLNLFSLPVMKLLSNDCLKNQLSTHWLYVLYFRGIKLFVDNCRNISWLEGHMISSVISLASIKSVFSRRILEENVPDYYRGYFFPEVNYVSLKRKGRVQKALPYCSARDIQTVEAFSEHERHPLRVTLIFSEVFIEKTLKYF